MTIKRIILVVLTIWAIAQIGSNLLESWGQPQFQSRLELYQTNLVLQASEVQSNDPSLDSARKALVGAEPTKTALDQYQEARQSLQISLKRSSKLAPSSATLRQQQTSASKLTRLLAELDLEIGLLQADQGKVDMAQSTWQGVTQTAASQSGLGTLSATAEVLTGLWSTPPRLLPNAEQQLKTHLDRWFRYRALVQLYQLQQRQDALVQLRIDEEYDAEQAFVSLAMVGGISAVGGLIGIVILLGLLVQWLIRGKHAILSPDRMSAWTTPWDGEVVWQVLIVGFFLVSQLVGVLLLPLVLGLLQQFAGLDLTTLSIRSRALYTLANYIALAAGGLWVLFWSIKSYLPLPDGWFRVTLKSNWILWGIGGYFTALPLVVLISLVNQKIWQGHGGSNPLLPLALESKDTVALSIFFLMAAIAAPVFEEILFRGFLLPSLTRYVPVWGAIALSSVIFAVAHLSLAEVLPLTMLGMVLGFVYARSQNLLSSMLLHSLWNSGTLLSLVILGSSSQ
jgi:membrane protease YdiL (CAAX protease family)